MISKEYRELIDKILIRTSQNKIKWEGTSDSDKFTCRITNKIIAMRSYIYNCNPEEADYRCISFEILDVFGDKIDGIYIDENETEYIKMSELYDAARRNALHIDKTIRDLLNALG